MNYPKMKRIIFITPEKGVKSQRYFEKLSNSYLKNHLYLGKNELHKEGLKETMLRIIKDILYKESIGDIEPIHGYTKYTLKAFSNFIPSILQPTRKTNQISKDS